MYPFHKLNLKIYVCYNVVPPVQQYNTCENPEYPYLGTDEERKQYTLYFNEKLKKNVLKKNIYSLIFIIII